MAGLSKFSFEKVMDEINSTKETQGRYAQQYVQSNTASSSASTRSVLNDL